MLSAQYHESLMALVAWLHGAIQVDVVERHAYIIQVVSIFRPATGGICIRLHVRRVMGWCRRDYMSLQLHICLAPVCFSFGFSFFFSVRSSACLFVFPSVVFPLIFLWFFLFFFCLRRFFPSLFSFSFPLVFPFSPSLFRLSVFFLRQHFPLVFSYGFPLFFFFFFPSAVFFLWFFPFGLPAVCFSFDGFFSAFLWSVFLWFFPFLRHTFTRGFFLLFSLVFSFGFP